MNVMADPQSSRRLRLLSRSARRGAIAFCRMDGSAGFARAR
jgi:hypothetical protein